jgi:ribosomal protein S12 methylthiotransferase
MIVSEPSFYMVSLGCAKNTVDSESMAVLLGNAGYSMSVSVEDADVLIVNTCGFIGKARDESLDELRKLADQKRSDQLLIAAGCLTQRYGEEIAKMVPGIDGMLGTRRWMDIVKVSQSLREGVFPEPLYHLPQIETVALENEGVPRVALQGASAYIKIADGCRRDPAHFARSL